MTPASVQKISIQRNVWRMLVVIAALCAVLVYWAYHSMVSHLALRQSVERRIGAVIGSPYVKAGDQFTEVIAFFHVKAESAAATAGIKEGDILADDMSIDELCERLDAPAGTRIALKVIPGGDGPSLSQRRERRVTLNLPVAV